ncbi:ATP-binding protein [Thermodesulfatator atlanticus]|uniref:ATP-binding protein n=1 Tax=Thermodesulfatator atlanticus TaxID=501497 RepID=UPI0003B302CC|nr:ATP-binding protein [Thermodesulfatator atlanticus]
MKQFHYKPRFLADVLRKTLSFAPIVVITGARQVGKSTLLANEPPVAAWPKYSLDDPEVLSFLEKHPKELVFQEKRLVIDEVQRLPKILPYIKLAVDEDRSRRYVLSGSANLLLMRQVSESLAGRAIYLELGPFSLDELMERKSSLLTFLETQEFPPADKPDFSLELLLFRGMIPPITTLEDSFSINLWWKGYIATYLERDLRNLSQVANLSDFHIFMEVLSSRTASLLNQQDVARDVGLSPATISRYLNLLETGGLITRLRPYFANINKRLTKRPKLYFFDCGLTRVLSGYHSPEEIPPEFWGKLFENFVFQELWALRSLKEGVEIFFFRTLGGKEIEIDFLLKHGKAFHAFEVKFASKITLKDSEPLLKIREILPGIKSLNIIYTGDAYQTLPGQIKVIPWWWL